jgi:hypothetical protein
MASLKTIVISDDLHQAQTVVLAGSETVAYTCYMGLFFLLSDRSILTKLQQELDEVWPDKEQTVSFQVLEKLPYLVSLAFAPELSSIDSVTSEDGLRQRMSSDRSGSTSPS